MKSLLLFALSLSLLACAEKKREQVKASYQIEIPIDCLTGPIVMLDCNVDGTICKRSVIRRRKGCEQLRVSK